MKAIILSAQKQVENEIDKVIEMFEEGMNTFHLRKPHYSFRKMKSYLDKVPYEFHNRIIIHSHHKLALKFNLKGIHLTSKSRENKISNWFLLRRIKKKNPWIIISTSLHSISELETYNDLYDYVFLSPIFDSISKQDYHSGFKEFSLSSATRRSNYKIVALGGVKLDNIAEAYKMGFWGCAFLGTIWNSEDPLQSFKEIKAKCADFKSKNNFLKNKKD